ncbi:hypothetical protein [Streptomyces sp. NPDC048581]|uniref:hypothetical protein n=1 Tax=unclassified Streptomyces TaxID=2593676 RepID=UPI0037154AB5
MKKISILTTSVLAVGAALIGAVPAHAGIADGVVNNAHVLADISLLNTSINSDSQLSENNNANTRADGQGNNATGQHE